MDTVPLLLSGDYPVTRCVVSLLICTLMVAARKVRDCWTLAVVVWYTGQLLDDPFSDALYVITGKKSVIVA